MQIVCLTDVAIDIPDVLDLSALRGTGIQPGEEELPTTVTQKKGKTIKALKNITMLLLLSYFFHDLKFCLSSQLKAASCARRSDEMPPSKQVSGCSFTVCFIAWCSPQSQSGEAM